MDLTSFRVVPNLDYYAAAYLTWDAVGVLRPETPALELSIRGTSNEHCLTFPCGASALGLVVRWSSNIKHDGAEPDEKRHCGEGVNNKFRLPIGAGNTVDVTVTWGPDARDVTVATSAASWTAKRGVGHPGFGFFYSGIPNSPKGIGWAREPWSIQRNGGTASLVSWESVAPLGMLTTCP